MSVRYAALDELSGQAQEFGFGYRGVVTVEEVVISARPSERFASFEVSVLPSDSATFLLGKPGVGKNIHQVSGNEEGVVFGCLIKRPEQLFSVAGEIGGEEKSHSEQNVDNSVVERFADPSDRFFAWLLLNSTALF